MPAGRPVGSTISPERRLESEIMAWLLVNQRIRKIVERQLTAFESKLTDQGNVMTLATHMEMMGAVRDLLGSTSKVVENGLKALNQDKAPGAKPVADDPDEIMRSLQGGQ
jgi:hypothetical protein